MKQNRKGMTFPEIMVVVFLVSVTLYLGLQLNLRSHLEQQSVKALAEKLSAFLELARTEAQSSGVCCGVGFPVAANQPACQSVYLFQGDTRPRITRVFNWAKENGDEFLFPTLTNNASPQPSAKLSVGEQEFDWSKFALAAPQHPVALFLPSGALISNGLPMRQGRFVITLARGTTLTPQSTSDSGIAYFQATQMTKPEEISLNPLGLIEHQKADGQYVSGGAVPAVCQPPEPSGKAGEAPVITDVRLQPDPKGLSLPGGVDAKVAYDGMLSMELEVELPTTSIWSGPFTCEWTCSGGELSGVGPARLNYLSDKGHWVAQWHWRPPNTATDGQPFHLECVVRDGLGHEVKGDRRCSIDLQVTRNLSRLAYIEDKAGQPVLHTVQSDGSGERLLTRADKAIHDSVASWSPDGTKLVTISNRTGNDELTLLMADGSTGAVLTAGLTGLNKGYPEFSPLGTKIAFTVQAAGAPHDIAVINADGSGYRNLTNSAGVDEVLPILRYNNYMSGCWSPDEKYLVYSGPSGLMISDIQSNSAPRVLGPGLSYTGDPCFSHKPQAGQYWIAFSATVGSQTQIYKVPADGSQAPVQLATQVDAESPRWSPDDSTLCFVSRYGSDAQQISTMSSNGGSVQQHTDTSSDEVAADWVDDQTISFISVRDGNREVYALNVSDDKTKNLTRSANNDFFFGWVK